MQKKDFKLSALTSDFLSPDVESAYQRHIFRQNLKNNVIAISILLAVHLAYSILDYNNWGDAALTSILARFTSFVLGFALLLCLNLKQVIRHHEMIAVLIVTIIGLSINVIIHYSPSLDDTYYVAFIQLSVFVCCFLRISFMKSITLMATFLIGFMIVASAKNQPEEAMLQTFILISMSVILIFSAYLLQRYRRLDFVKTSIIAQQNDQLSEMLANTQRDNQRKLAALNMLLHTVKTPLHQISGFTDIVLNQLRALDENTPGAKCLDSAQYIKSASDDLRHGVSKLLAYHQLDEIARTPQIENFNMREIIRDLAASAEDKAEIHIEKATHFIRTDRRILETAISSLFNNLKWAENEACRLAITMRDEDDALIIDFADNGPGMTQESFQKATIPLTEIDNYLNGDGSSLTMGLRTAARAMEIGGGRIAYTPDLNAPDPNTPDQRAPDQRSVFSLIFPKEPQFEAAAAEINRQNRDAPADGKTASDTIAA